MKAEKSRLPKPVVRVGVKTTYHLHDRLLTNRTSRRLLVKEPPTLDETQQEIIDGLRSEGYVSIPFKRLFDEEKWSKLAADSADFVRRIEAQLEAEEIPPEDPKERRRWEKRRQMGGKQYIRRAYTRGTELDFDDPWLALGASTRMLDIVNSYLGLWSKLSYIDQWYTLPSSEASERVASQRWHRDYNDQHLVKVFIYMNDVDEGTGPFEYVSGSVKDGPYGDEWAWRPYGDVYPPEHEFQQRIPEGAARTLTGPAGTMIFCNTSGFHRGGFATERKRISAVYNYVSQASLESLSERNFHIGEPRIPPGTPEAVRFALT